MTTETQRKTEQNIQLFAIILTIINEIYFEASKKFHEDGIVVHALKDRMNPGTHCKAHKSIYY